MHENVPFISFSRQMEMSVPRVNCFGGSSAEPRYPLNTVIHRDGYFDSYLKPLKDTYTKATLYKRSARAQTIWSITSSMKLTRLCYLINEDYRVGY